MASSDILRALRAWKKSTGVIDTPLGPVTLGRQLGQGGNALVYAAPEPKGMAVKLLVEDVSERESERYRRFRAEYLHLVRLVPTGMIVPLYQFGTVEIEGAEVPYILMERCQGTLRDQIKDSPIRTEQEFLALLGRLVLALGAVHSEGIVHRDLKPENVLLRPAGDWVLGDFGIAWFDPDRFERDVETKKGDRLGNVAFAAPEQLRRDLGEPKPSMDYYALGQVLYWAVTGTTIRGTSHASLRETSPELGRFDPLVEALVRQDPNSRPQSKAEIRTLITTPERDPDTDRYYEMRRQQDAFDRALRKALPGSHGPTEVSESHWDRVLDSLAESCDEADLYVHYSSGEAGCCPIRKDETGWVLGLLELPIEEVWVYRDLE